MGLLISALTIQLLVCPPCDATFAPTDTIGSDLDPGSPGPLAEVLRLDSAGDAEDLMRGNECAVHAEPALRAASDSGCSAYDCEFVVLARDLGVPLVTTDAAVTKAFSEVAVTPEAFVA